MQKLRVGHRAQFRDKNKSFVHVLFPVRASLRRIFTSGTLRARLLLKISIPLDDSCILAMSCVGYKRAAV